jgi:cytoskeleton protein RodZ
MLAKNVEPGLAENSPAESPGRLIAAAREAHSINPADLAARLRLDTKIIKALERDDFENLPAPTFVKGYIRSIANELNIDATLILEAYAAHASLEPPTLADFSSRAPDQVGINSTIIKMVTYVLTASLILLIVLWWRSNYQNDDVRGARTPGGDVITGEAAAAPLSYSYRVVEHDDVGWRVIAPAVPPSDDVGDPAGLAEETRYEVDSGLDELGRLTISTTSEAWVEVYDAAGGRLYYGMGRADKTVEISGHQYYRLVLGNAESVTLRLDGENIDLQPHSEQGVAQLVLGTAPQSADGAR